MLDSFKDPPARYRTFPRRIYNSGTDEPLSIREMKRRFDRQIASGDNLHSSNELLPNCPHIRLFADYMSRVSYALSQGKRKAQIALLQISTYPTDFFDFYNTNLPMEHLAHDIVDEDDIRTATAVDQHLIISGNEYEALILPPLRSISYEAALVIQEFVEDGGRIIATVMLPTEDTEGKKHREIRSIFADLFDKRSGEFRPSPEPMSMSGDGIVTQFNNGALFVETQDPNELITRLRNCISMAIKPEVSVRNSGLECRDIIFVHRASENEDIFFFANSSCDAREVQISIRCDKAPHVLDPNSGEQIALVNCTQKGSRTMLLHRFEGCGSLLLHFDDEPSLSVPMHQFEIGQEVKLSDEWNIALNESGTASYSQKVFIPDFLRSQRVIIKVEEPPNTVDFIVNGAVAGVRLWPPYEMDITALIKPGPNEITLKITSSAHVSDLGGVRITIY